MDPQQSDIVEHVIDQGHALLQAAANGLVLTLLNDRSVADFIGAIWVERHPSVRRAIAAFEQAIESDRLV
ncbi:hypothetical protein [Xanthomonas arboricola]|uniref:hypothetical protein n=1 Tax=Xanthomonas arboricola TaxID=56448 RepID=UPI0012905BCA|nr:hypothetical protein [Xanthomonas arboricola]